MKIEPNLDFKPTKPQIMLFIRHYIYNTSKPHTVTSKEMTNIFYFQLFNKRPRPHEKDKLDSNSRLFGKCLTEISEKFPQNIKIISNSTGNKYIIYPIKKNI